MENTNNELLEVKDLRKYYSRTRGFMRRVLGTVKAVDGVSFSIKKGEILGLVGESGCGKTTTGKCIIRAVESTSGNIYFNMNQDGPVDIASMDKAQVKEIHKHIRMIFQDPFSSLNPRMPVIDIVGEALKNYKVVTKRKDLEETVAELLRMVHLDPTYMQRYPHAFSGGQRQRIAIARALALQPELILADEPVSALDVSVQAQILNLLEELQEEFDLSYLFVAHDLAVVKYICNRIAVMYVGKIVESSETENIFFTPKHPYTEALLSAAPNPEPRLRDKKARIVLGGRVADPANPPSGCYFHPRCRYAESVCKNEEPPLVNIGKDNGAEHLVACHFADKLELRGVER